MSSSNTTATDIIVHWKTDPTDSNSDPNHQKVTSLGGQYKNTYHHIHGASYRLSANQIAKLAKDPSVAFISPDHALKSSGTQALDYFREAVHSDVTTSAGWNGSGIGIAVIDSGITPNADIPTPVYSQSFVSGDTNTADAYGHGTHVAGIIAGTGANSHSKSTYTFGGAAKGVSLINLRALDANGGGTDSSVIAAIEAAIALKSTYNIRVINLSLGRPITDSYVNDPLCQEVEAAWKAGIVVVVAAGNEGRNNSVGNDGYGTILAPGNDPYVITVGAIKTMKTPTRGDDFIASYSSKGPTLIDHFVKPDVVAPGNLVISVEVPGSTLSNAYTHNSVASGLYLNDDSIPYPHKYFLMSGTSMATPVVSAAAAAMLQKNPGLTPDIIKARLMKTASKSFPVSSVATDPATNTSYTSYYDAFTIGAGYLDISAALADNSTGTGSALSPSAVYNSANNTATMVNGSSVIWGTSVSWGTSVIWGTNVFVGSSSVLWGTSVSWGTMAPSSASVIWGTTSGSAASVIWGTSTTSALTSSLGEN